MSWRSMLHVLDAMTAVSATFEPPRSYYWAQKAKKADPEKRAARKRQKQARKNRRRHDG